MVRNNVKVKHGEEPRDLLLRAMFLVPGLQ